MIRTSIALSLNLLLVTAIGCNSSSEPGPSAPPPAPERSASGAEPRAGGEGRLVVLSDQNFDAEVLKSKVPVLVDFWATWCGPCRQLAPTIDALAAAYAGRIKVGKLDVDKNEAIAGKYGISSIPAVFLFKDGKVAEQVIGLNPRKSYEAIIEKHAPAQK